MRRIVVLMSVAALATVGVVFGRGLIAGKPSTAPPAPEPSPLFVPSDKLDFGRAWESNRFAWSFPVTNTSADPLTVSGIASSCSCLSVSPLRFTLAPNETITVTATVDLTAKARATEDAAFLLSPIVDLPAGTPAPKIDWLLKGKTRKLFTLSRPATFGRMSVLDQPLKPVRIAITTTVPLDRGLSAKTDRADIAATVIPDPADACKYTLELTAQTNLPLGGLKGVVTLTPTDSREKALPPAEVPFDGLVAADVECVPPSVLGGGHSVGATFAHSVALASLGKRPFKVLSATAEGAGLR